MSLHATIEAVRPSAIGSPNPPRTERNRIAPRANADADQRDPIFALIEAHKAACVENEAAVKENGALNAELPRDRQTWPARDYDKDPPVTDDPRWIASQRRTWRATDEVFNLANDMIDHPPTSLAGARALLEYVHAIESTTNGVWQFPDYFGDDETETEWDVALLNAIAQTIKLVESEAATGDAEIVRLSAQFVDAYGEFLQRAERTDLVDEEVDLFFEGQRRLEEALVSTPATTVAGLRAKANAVAAIPPGDEGAEWHNLSVGDETTDVRIAGSILRDLVAMK